MSVSTTQDIGTITNEKCILNATIASRRFHGELSSTHSGHLSLLLIINMNMYD